MDLSFIQPRQELRPYIIRPGVFDTREWTGDVRVGGRWQASGVARGNPYALEGEFIAVDPPGKLVHTWIAVGEPVEPMKGLIIWKKSTQERESQFGIPVFPLRWRV
jgi:uncharacterized protein YndB with AHSA1/START domain